VAAAIVIVTLLAWAANPDPANVSNITCRTT